ncbi:Na(+)-translocating NADH-quinone reductase subunit A [Sinomicrobium weinanense]|uniref:Na(+)-translocating NADH-quinone reductase subunit A n=1 Tax=Sinomicrobium weinanense TaxID=2842200 RepID=A0A926JWC3_9FLAO|nr:Na(+)-translocating NADH-quinone reductase subunit A [Sinomicrobium weinanense]MBC9798574.1 Na(+)-translocating NADH-quinone reductase subunit A [Sinomicrobium weinanense]MBU3121917.1 Na(+)-translocating NADH-quinone reductase subunit A [Sinomicrobium weinanense]
MSNDIRIRKGLNINLEGEAEKVVSDAPRVKTFALKPTDFHSITPKMVVKEGEKIKAGDVIFFSKYNEKIKFVAPVSGTISEIRRGAKRRILEVVIDADNQDDYKEFGAKDPGQLSAEEIKEYLLESGCWPFIRQRPYDVIANPEETPKAIFISAYASAPLAADVEFVLQGREEDFQAGIDAVAKLTAGKTHLSVNKKSSSFLNEVKGVELHKVSGPHPSGNVGVQIHHIDPVNAGERVWVINPEDVAVIGKLFRTGQLDTTRIVAVAGSEIEKPQYYRVKIGSGINALVKNDSGNVRIISGDVLTGDKIAGNSFLGYYHNTVTVIPEGNEYRMFGWLPFKDNNIPSMHHTSFSWLFPKKKYKVNTNLNGEERALVVTGEMEKVMPMDVYPMQLLKACMVNNIEKMEHLGIYEVAPEDFALIDYACTSKIEAQDIIRQGLDLMIKEVG